MQHYWLFKKKVYFYIRNADLDKVHEAVVAVIQKVHAKVSKKESYI